MTDKTIAPFTVPTTPEEITEENWYPLVNSLMRAQFRCTAQELESNVEYWGEDFISDDGTDYTTTALDACSALMGLRYEGDRDELVTWLFGDADDTLRFGPGLTLQGIDSAGGLCNELVAFARATYNADLYPEDSA